MPNMGFSVTTTSSPSTIAEGTILTTSVANATGVVTYQWEMSSDGGTTWQDVGANLPYFQIPEGGEGAIFQVVATDTGTGATASSAPTAAAIDVTPVITPQFSVSLL